jgi:hypothetical protein
VIAAKAVVSQKSESGKMSTFVSAILSVQSRRYAEFMSTFVYRVEEAARAESRG